jgi:hypothetical protein
LGDIKDIGAIIRQICAHLSYNANSILTHNRNDSSFHILSFLLKISFHKDIDFSARVLIICRLFFKRAIKCCISDVQNYYICTLYKKINAFTLYRKSIDKPNCYKTSLKQWRYSRRAIVTLEINMFF